MWAQLYGGHTGRTYCIFFYMLSKGTPFNDPRSQPDALHLPVAPWWVKPLWVNPWWSLFLPQSAFIRVSPFFFMIFYFTGWELLLRWASRLAIWPSALSYLELGVMLSCSCSLLLIPPVHWTWDFTHPLGSSCILFIMSTGSLNWLLVFAMQMSCCLSLWPFGQGKTLLDIA